MMRLNIIRTPSMREVLRNNIEAQACVKSTDEHRASQKFDPATTDSHNDSEYCGSAKLRTLFACSSTAPPSPCISQSTPDLGEVRGCCSTPAAQSYKLIPSHPCCQGAPDPSPAGHLVNRTRLIHVHWANLFSLSASFSSSMRLRPILTPLLAKNQPSFIRLLSLTRNSVSISIISSDVVCQ